MRHDVLGMYSAVLCATQRLNAKTALVTIAARDLAVLSAKQRARAVQEAFIVNLYIWTVVGCVCGQHRGHMPRQQLHGQVLP
jgi:hypothetical protein